jgi:hypothetical protein
MIGLSDPVDVRGVGAEADIGADTVSGGAVGFAAGQERYLQGLHSTSGRLTIWK